MLIKSFSIYNFLNYDYYTINFDKFSTIKDVNVLKSLYVFKYLITLSEDHPELASLVTNEVKPKQDEETIFKLEVEVNSETYTYQLNVFNNEITFEEFTNNNKLIYQRANNEIVLEEEPFIWNCENGKYKPFLNTCATSSNEPSTHFFYFMKEGLEGMAEWISSSLNDLVKNLFNDEPDELLLLIRNINIYNNNSYTTLKYPMDVEILNELTNFNFKNLMELRTRKFLKLNIFITWLSVIQGGILVIDDSDLLEFEEYINNYVNYLNNIQVLMIK